MKHTMMFAAIAVVTVAFNANPTQISNGVPASKDGKTLYVFDKDAAGRSNRNSGCAAAWPPFVVANAALAAGDFSTVLRGQSKTTSAAPDTSYSAGYNSN